MVRTAQDDLGLQVAKPTPLGMFGHHPDAGTDFCCEVEALEGMAYEVVVGVRGAGNPVTICGEPERHTLRCSCHSEWPFWNRLSHAKRAVRLGEFPHDAWTPGAIDTLNQLEGRVLAKAALSDGASSRQGKPLDAASGASATGGMASK